MEQSKVTLTLTKEEAANLCALVRRGAAAIDTDEASVAGAQFIVKIRSAVEAVASEPEEVSVTPPPKKRNGTEARANG